MSPSYLAQSVDSFLDALAAATPAPAGGSAAALAVAQSGALCLMTARISARRLGAERAGRLASDSETIRRAAASLVDLDAQAYSRVIEAIRAAKASTAGAAAQAESVATALSDAANVPMRLIELAIQAAELATALAAEGNPALRGDAITAGLLAQAGARAAAKLVRINLSAVPGDARLARVDELLARIAEVDPRTDPQNRG